ncbi:HNH endonuclease signature motif containing protein [Mycobacterium sp. NPDC050853]|uniref:HNH endonuclease signature motif containing protein n=1 Tax=Mycobacterium sp. NPDC050853 TaxID=3155160 RepID=UPI0033CFBD34
MSSIDDLTSATAAVAGSSFDELNNPELLTALRRLEAAQRQITAASHTLLARLVARGSPVELGGTSFADVVARRLSISTAAARRRLADAAHLGPRRAITGEPLEPQLPHTALALREGRLGDEHVRIIRRFFDVLPDAVDADTRAVAEERLASMGTEFGPEQLRGGADRIAALINPDGRFSDVDRARRRGVSIGRQGADGMSPVSGLLDPETRAYLDAVLSKLAAPGMCNPADESPGTGDAPDPAAAERDTRTTPQRNHDALRACLRSTLASGGLGSHHGLPVTVVVSTTLKELQSASGRAVLGGGNLLPIPDLIRMAAHAHHYLAVFDDAGARPLYLGRSKRIATPDQRIVLHAKDRGCSAPGCTVPGYLCQVHHVDEWCGDGPTDIDNLTFACGPHHRLLQQGWITRKRRSNGFTEWIPPPHLDTGQSRTNDYHHPERFVRDRGW